MQPEKDNKSESGFLPNNPRPNQWRKKQLPGTTVPQQNSQGSQNPISINAITPRDLDDLHRAPTPPRNDPTVEPDWDAMLAERLAHLADEARANAASTSPAPPVEFLVQETPPSAAVFPSPQQAFNNVDLINNMLSQPTQPTRRGRRERSNIDFSQSRGGNGHGRGGPRRGGPGRGSPGPNNPIRVEKPPFEVVADRIGAPVDQQKEPRLKEWCESVGLAMFSTVSQLSTVNPHARSAAVRYVATARALGAAKRAGVRNLLSVYGSERDEKICQIINHQASTQLVVQADRPVLVPDDLNRSGTTVADFIADGILLVNIYAQETGPVTAQWLADLATTGPVIWVGYRFTGVMGTVHDEAAWKRHDDLIWFFPDLQSPSYPGHVDLSWLTTSGCNDLLVWSPVCQIQDMFVVKIERREKYPRMVSLTRPIVPAYDDIISVPVYRVPAAFDDTARALISFCCKWNLPWKTWLCKRENITVHYGLKQDLQTWMAARSAGGQLYKTLSIKAIELATALPRLALLTRFFPHDCTEIIQNSVEAAYSEHYESRARAISALQATTANNARTYNTQLAGLDQPAPPFWMGFAKTVLYSAAALYTFGRLFSLLKWLWQWLKIWLVRAFNRAKTAGHALAKQTLTSTTLWKPFSSSGSFQTAMILAAPFYEEPLKRIIPNGWALLAALETGEHLRRLPWRTAWPVCLQSFLAHYALSLYPVKPAIAMHFVYNGVTLLAALSPEWSMTVGVLKLALTASALTYPAPLSIWAAYARAFYQEPWESRHFTLPQEHRTSPFSPEESIIRKQTRSYCELPTQCPDMKVKGSFTLGVQETTTSVYFHLPTNVPQYSPARTDDNLWSVIFTRITAKPPLDPKTQTARWIHFIKTTKLRVVDHEPPMELSNIYDAWLEHIEDANKKKRMLHAAEQNKILGVDDNANFFNVIKIMVKTDETLMRLTPLGMKPRAIANVNPRAQEVVGPYVYEATQRLSRQWSFEQPYRIFSLYRTVFLTYGSKSTDKDLTLWMRKCLELSPGEAAVLVAGDDSLVCVNHFGRLQWFEGDASMYDQSQSRGPLTFELLQLRVLGVPEDITRKLAKLDSASYLAVASTGEKIKINRQRRPIRNTGGPNTTFGNSSIMATTWVCALTMTKEVDLKLIDQTFTYFGFKMKWRQNTDPQKVSFLKGKWYHTSQGLVWGPLPSRFLKLGKSLRDPKELYKGDRVQATRQFMAQLAASMRNFLPVPVLRAFVRRYDTGVTAQPLEPWKVSASGAFAHLTVEDVHILSEWYGADDGHWGEVELQILSSDPFTFLEHPLYALMALRDYN